jgi:hypothetical protein
MDKAPGPKIKKRVQRTPKMDKSPRSKNFILDAMTGYGTAQKIGKSTGVKFEVVASGFSPNQNSKPKWGSVSPQNGQKPPE